MQLRNARIKDTNLGFEDHGILTANISLDYGSSGQSFGGLSLGPTRERLEQGDGFGTRFIATVLDVIEVDSWEKLIGKHIRVIQSNEKVWAIGNIIKNKWFYPTGEVNSEVTKIIEDLDRI